MILIEKIHPQIWMYQTKIKMPFPLNDRFFAHYIFRIDPSPHRTVFVYLPCFPEDLESFPQCKEVLAILNMAVWDFEVVSNISRKFSEKVISDSNILN